MSEPVNVGTMVHRYASVHDTSIFGYTAGRMRQAGILRGRAIAEDKNVHLLVLPATSIAYLVYHTRSVHQSAIPPKTLQKVYYRYHGVHWTMRNICIHHAYIYE